MSELALQLIAENKRTKNPSLYLGKCGLREVPKELFDCVWLEELILSNCWRDRRNKKNHESANKGSDNYLSEIPNEIANLQNLKVLKTGGWYTTKKSNFSDIRFIQSLTGLQSLDLSYNEISDISFLQSLAHLQSLDLSYNNITDISFLQSLTNLKYIDLSNNPISDYNPLQSLTGLQ